MSDFEQDPDETEEGVGTPVLDSDNWDDQYELNDVADDADYYGTDDDETDEVTA